MRHQHRRAHCTRNRLTPTPQSKGPTSSTPNRRFVVIIVIDEILCFPAFFLLCTGERPRVYLSFCFHYDPTSVANATLMSNILLNQKERFLFVDQQHSTPTQHRHQHQHQLTKVFPIQYQCFTISTNVKSLIMCQHVYSRIRSGHKSNVTQL